MDRVIKLRDTEAIDASELTKALSRYQSPSKARSIWQIVNTFTPYIGLWALSYYALSYSFWLALPVIVVNSGFLIRIFIIFHDCGHGTFFSSKRVNRFWGVVTGILTFTPYYFWSKNHARHHATSGNLDKRGFGDVWMMTVDEYLQATTKERLKYRLYRNPFVMFFLGPLLIMLVSNRIVRRKANVKEKRSVIWTNAGILLFSLAMSFAIGFKAYIIIQFLTLLIGSIGGVWLFYVQHQFDGVYWARDHEWDFFEASLTGGSFYKLPVILRWFTGSIGYHHIHHLNSRIPNYHLARCQRKIPILEKSPTVGVFSSLKSLKYRLWDEDKGKMVGFKAVKSLSR